MIEQWAEIIIKDLGPTGLLVLCLYIYGDKYLKSACKSLETINHELGEIRDALKICIEVEKITGQKR